MIENNTSESTITANVTDISGVAVTAVTCSTIDEEVINCIPAGAAPETRVARPCCPTNRTKAVP